MANSTLHIMTNSYAQVFHLQYLTNNLKFRISHVAIKKCIKSYQQKAPTDLNTRHPYQLDAIDNLQPGIIHLAVDHKIDHKYPKLLKIPLLNTENTTVKFPRKTIIGRLKPIDITDSEVNNITWTTDGTTTMDKPTQ